MELTIEELRRLCEAGAVRWTAHIVSRMLQRGLTRDDVISTIRNGEIIERYPTDYPFPSCLVLGVTLNRGPLHVVAASAWVKLI